MKRVELLAQKLPDQTAPVAREQASSRQRQAICEKIFAMTTTQARVYAQTIRPGLSDHGIYLLDWHDLTEGSYTHRDS
jgi:hypothetical protein